MILLIDNYDSFVHNLARYFQRLGHQTQVVRNDAIDVATIARSRPAAIVLSPGPCTPNEAGCSLDVARELHTDFPMLGICLGHQTIADALGAEIVRANKPMHGRTSSIKHQSTGLLREIPSPFQVCRYHSLAIKTDSLPAVLHETAASEDGTIMAIEHVNYPVFGVQFHPEAILTEHGFQLLDNFLALAGLGRSESLEALTASEHRLTTKSLSALPTNPVTF